MSGRTQRLRISITGRKVYPSLEDVALVVDLDELAPVGGRATSRGDGRTFERFAKMGQDLLNRPWLRDERDQPNVATTRWTLKRKLLPTRAMSFAHAIREVSWEGGLSRKSQQSPVVSWPAACPPNACPLGAASRGLPTFPFVMRRDGGPELVIRGKHPVIPVPMLPRPGHEVSEPVEELKWGKLDDAAGARPCGRPPASRADPVGRLVPGEHVADAGDAAVFAAHHGEPLQREGRPGTVSQQVLETLKIARHVAVDERNPDAGGVSA